MSKDKQPKHILKNDNNKTHQSSDQDKKKDKEELNRRKALKTILGASSLMVINPFSINAQSTRNLVTQTPTPTTTPTPSVTTSPTATQTPTPTTTPTPSVTASPTATQTPTPTTTPTPSVTASPTATQTPTPTPTPTSTQTPTPTTTPTPSVTSTQTPTPTNSPTPDVTPSSSVTPTPTSTNFNPLPSFTPTPSTSSSILPVELSEFGVREENGVIKLYWKTESEINNKGFEIQRSTNAITFHKIGWVNGAGDTNHSKTYEFEEIDVVSNQWYYYRLKQVDFNGDSNYSKTIAIMINQKDKTTVKEISPNIVTDNFVNIEISAGTANNAEIFIHHINGQLIARKKVVINQGNNVINMNLRNAASGMCVINVKFSTGKSQTKRFVIKR